MQETGLRHAMNTRIIGSGTEAIILAHGLVGDQSFWDKITPDLAKHYKVLVFDWTFAGAVKDPNHFDPVKYSSYDGFATDLIALLDEFDLKASVFVGHSMSGMIGCIASIKRPDLFKRLILVAASPRYINTDDYEGGFKNSDIESIMSNISNYQNWAQNFATLAVEAIDPPLKETLKEKLTKSLQNMRPEVAFSVTKTVFYSDERAILEKVMTPCTIVQTTNDIAVPNSVAHFMQEKISGTSTVAIVETDGHFPQLTAPNQLIDLINGVLGFEGH